MKSKVQYKWFTLTTLLLLFMIPQIQSVLGVDLVSPVSLAAFKCMKNQKAKFAIISAYRSFGAIDANCDQNLRNAKNAGLITDILMSPCRGKDPEMQGQQVIDKIQSSLYQKIWIVVEKNPSPGCQWNKYYEVTNCEFLKTLVTYMTQRGKNIGIYSSKYMWKIIVGSEHDCPEIAQFTKNLWYPQYDNQTTFDDFIPFGAWTRPTIKQYAGDIQMCGVNVNPNYAL